MAPGPITYVGTGRQTIYTLIHKGRNVHGTLMVGGAVALWGVRKQIVRWYKRHQLYVWYWLVFSTWITLGIMVGLMFYAVMP